MKTMISDDELRKYDNVPTDIAAKALGKDRQYILRGLKQRSLPIGSANQGDGGRWCFDIPPERLIRYRNGTMPIYNIQIHHFDGVRLKQENKK